MDPKQAQFDVFSLWHLALGVGMGAVGVSLPSAGGIIIYLNFIAQDLAREAPGLFGASTPDTWQNSLSDSVVELGGYYIGRSIFERGPVP